MKTFSKILSPDEVLEILKKHFNVKDARVGCYTDKGLWQGLWFDGYDKPLLLKEEKEEEEEEEDEKDIELDDCEQCNEPAWDGYICHACGLKHI